MDTEFPPCLGADPLPGPGILHSGVLDSSSIMNGDTAVKPCSLLTASPPMRSDDGLLPRQASGQAGRRILEEGGLWSPKLGWIADYI